MDEDLEIIERFKAGDKEAFSILVNKYKKPVLNLVYRFIGIEQDAEDLAQEVFLRAYRGLDRFESRAKFFTWLYKITMNLCLRERERKSKFVFQSLEQKVENKYREAEMELSSTSNPVGEALDKEEMGIIVQKAVMELPPDQRAAVILHRYHDLSYEEIAEVMNISVPAVKSRLHRAREILKEKLRRYVLE